MLYHLLSEKIMKQANGQINRQIDRPIKLYQFINPADKGKVKNITKYHRSCWTCWLPLHAKTNVYNLFFHEDIL